MRDRGGTDQIRRMAIKSPREGTTTVGGRPEHSCSYTTDKQRRDIVKDDE